MLSLSAYLRRRYRIVFGILGWIIFGAIVGIVAKFLHPGRDPGGFLVTILLGIAGSLLGGFVGRVIGLYREGQGAGFIMSVLGAILLLVIYHAVGHRRAV
jgi:uncharacterized membrane protein YeaQ/YmgE (transglycosylase-associated protein family)